MDTLLVIAIENTKRIRITEENKLSVRGVLAGVMTIDGRFEFAADDGAVLRGKIVEEAPFGELAAGILQRGQATIATRNVRQPTAEESTSDICSTISSPSDALRGGSPDSNRAARAPVASQ